MAATSTDSKTAIPQGVCPACTAEASLTSDNKGHDGDDEYAAAELRLQRTFAHFPIGLKWKSGAPAVFSVMRELDQLLVGVENRRMWALMVAKCIDGACYRPPEAELRTFNELVPIMKAVFRDGHPQLDNAIAIFTGSPTKSASSATATATATAPAPAPAAPAN